MPPTTSSKASSLISRPSLISFSWLFPFVSFYDWRTNDFPPSWPRSKERTASSGPTRQGVRVRKQKSQRVKLLAISETSGSWRFRGLSVSSVLAPSPVPMTGQRLLEFLPTRRAGGVPNVPKPTINPETASRPLYSEAAAVVPTPQNFPGRLVLLFSNDNRTPGGMAAPGEGQRPDKNEIRWNKLSGAPRTMGMITRQNEGTKASGVRASSARTMPRATAAGLTEERVLRVVLGHRRVDRAELQRGHAHPDS